MSPGRVVKNVLPVLGLLLLVVGCQASCPPDRPRGEAKISRTMLPVGAKEVEFQCDLKKCAWPEPCDRRNISIHWRWRPENSMQYEEEIVVPRSDLIYPDEGADCEDCVRYRNTSLEPVAGYVTFYCYLDPPAWANKTGKCYLSHATVRIGELPPSIPDADLTCIAQDWEKMECQWCPEGSKKSEFNWSFKYVHEYDNETKGCSKNESCDPGKECCLKGCTARMNFGVFHRIADYKIIIERKNGYGTRQNTFIRSFKENSIQPSPVRGLFVQETQQRSLTIGWLCPHISLNIVHLKYQINISSVQGEEMYFYTDDGNIVTHECNNDTELYTERLENLTPNVAYTISVRSRAYLSKHWSQTTTITKFTAEDVPARNPLTRGSSYRSIRQHSRRTVILYYQDIPLAYVGGRLEKVIVREVGPVVYRSHTTCKMKERECTIPDLESNRKYEFVVEGETPLGYGPAKATSRFVLTELDSGPHVPKYFAVEVVSTSLENKTSKLNFTWIGAETNETVDHVIYYRTCKNHVGCQGGVNWWVVPSNASWLLTDLHHREQSTNDYSFTIGVEDKSGRSEGMLDWISCVYKANGGLSKAPEVAERAHDSAQTEDSLRVIWKRQVCAKTDGRIVAYSLHVLEVDVDGKPTLYGYRGNVTVAPSEDSHVFLDLPPKSRYSVTLTSVMRHSTFTSRPVIMPLKVPPGPLIWPFVVLSLVILVVTVTGLVVCAYKRYRRIERSAHNFTRPEIDDPVRYVVSHDEDYLMPELNGQIIAEKTPSNTSSVSSENEGSEDKKLLPARNGAIRGPERNSAESERTRYTTAAPVPNGHVPGDQTAPNGTHPPVGVNNHVVNHVNHVPSRVPTKLVPVPLSSDEGDSDYCRFGEPNEPNEPSPITVAAVHSIHQRPNLGRQPFETNDKDRQLKEYQRRQHEPSPPPDSDYDYSKVGVAYLPRKMSSTDSEKPETPRAVVPGRGPLSLISDDSGYLVPNSLATNSDGDTVNNNTYGLESDSPTLSPAHSDEDVFDSDQSVDGVRVDVADRGDAHIPGDYVPSMVYNRDATPTRGDEATPTPSMKGCDRPVSEQERSSSVSPRPSGNDVIPAARPVSYHDAGYASNDSLPKPKPSCESNGLSDVDEGYNGNRPPSHDKESTPSAVSPPIQTTSSPSPRLDSPSASLDYVTMDDIIMV